ncbi:methylated-DNA--[protein]-cysteine S-methyltransferase [Rubrivivax gelatinosus]|uniref:Methylated-DNA--protein-cysteine methyltransferase n=1 Tax=Rubrivivax gelatinosus TaxID=28068 RepID=A0ABS1DVT2_RUBGE|nr:methylated-DNA--[protein]-cysteine S-methyltransferase [Rubrivivax gelatinosus]MBK1712892.1 cysteine methyltransferase [Rubrivivax gelatinosus]
MRDPRLEAQARLDTPLGPVTLAASAAGLAGLWFDAQRHHPGPLDLPLAPQQPHLAQAAAELSAYFQGQGSGFAVALDAEGTDFQRAVWDALRLLAAGTTTSYAEIARRIGRPSALRAVGAAIGRNPVSIVVPCHRVIGSAGALTGYAGGLDRKQALLALERGVAA